MVVYLGSTRVGTTIIDKSLGIPLEVSEQGVLQKQSTPFTWKSQGNDLKGFRYYFSSCTGLTSADLSSITRLTEYGALGFAFSGCTNLVSVDLSNLTTVDVTKGLANAFNNCPKLINVDFSRLSSIKANGVFSAYETGVVSGAFSYCTSLQTLSFPSLNSTSFGSYTNQFNNMLTSVTGCTVHFPSNLQSVIGSWTSVTGGFGGTNTTVLFDLPATT